MVQNYRLVVNKHRLLNELSSDSEHRKSGIFTQVKPMQ